MKKSLISTAIESLTPEEIERLAIESGFQVRKPRKITPLELLNLYCLESISIAPSFNDISGILGDVTGNAPSRQAVGKRINSNFTNFLKMILERVLADKILGSYTEKQEEHNSSFKNVIVQDSTVVKLPEHLFSVFSGVSNGHKSVCNARIQGVYDLISKKFLSFSIDKYSKNDFAAAPELVFFKDDLILRDRGYLTHSEIKRIKNIGAFFIYRHISSMVYRDPATDEIIDLAKQLKKNGNIDMDVCLNDQERTPVRLVSAPIDEETANMRRMRERKNAHGHNPSDNVLFLMSWTIFITNLPRNEFKFKKILAIYGLRWRIEVIFKAWKSNMAFSVIHRVSEQQLRAMLIARLIIIVIIMHCIYRRCEQVIITNTGKYLSMLKLMRYIQVRRKRLLEIITGLSQTLLKTSVSLSKFCSYDKRTRLNYAQCEAMALAEISLS